MDGRAGDSIEWLDVGRRVLSAALTDQTAETLDIVGYANTVVIRACPGRHMSCLLLPAVLKRLGYETSHRPSSHLDCSGSIFLES
ncbi:hypothetical protein QFZ23_002068 [Arthrobacter globiformis]|nr:hypothetical protein [Arthrobacter globiformis]